MHNRVQYEPINADAFEQDSDSATSESSHVIEKQRLQPKEGCAKFCLHLRLLLLKNILLFWRSKKITLFQFLTPILCLLVIFVLQIIANDFQDINFPNPPVKDLNKLPHCKGDECITLGYGIIGDTNDTNSPDYEWIHHTVKYAAEKHNLKFGKDVQQIIMSNTTKSIKSYFDTHENKTWYGVVFCTTEWEDGITSNITIPCRAQNTHGEDPKIDLKFYSILYNFTLMPSTFLDNFTAPMKPDPVMLTIKNTIDSGILDYLKKKKANDNNIGLAYESEVDFDDGDPADIYIQSSYSNFPLVTSRFFKDANIMSLVGSFYLALGPLVCFVVIFTEVVKEKELKLRQGLSVVGLSHTSYWLHWMISGVFFSSLISITTILGGLAFQFDLFYNANLVIVFMLYFLFGIAMILFAFILSTMVSTQKVAYTVSYAFVLLAIIIQLVLTNSLVTFFLFFNDKSDSSIFFIRALFYMYPPFAYSLIFGLIVRKATTHFDENGQQFVKGTSFSWGDLVIPETGEFSIGDKYSSPTPLHCFGMLVMLIAIYLVFLWYFDHVISSNRGTNESFYFFLTPKYYENLCCRKKSIQKRKRKRRETRQEEIEDPNKLNVDDSVSQEKLKVISDVRDGITCEGMRVINLKKTFNKYPCGIKSVKDTYANRGIYLDMSQRELLCILGHNGAGKSTMIGVLTGVIAPSSGTATLGGFDINEEIDEVRQIIGVVPQFDILWEELTAEEHMVLFCKIKGVPNDQIEKVVDEKLAAVNLLDVKKARTKTFSGGMKRRLTVAISCIGDPRIVFMDEPTTGMDPVSRRQVWNLIQELKSTRYVILTTHSMEEADVLGDRIAVIVDGEFKCIGTPLYLKNNFGDGYRITIVTEQSNVDRATELMAKLVPEAKILDESGGSIVFCVPISKISDIIPILKLIEKQTGTGFEKIEDPYLQELRSIVSDCGLSQTTLEEVFMLVTGKKQAKEKKSITPSVKDIKTPISKSPTSTSSKKYEEVKGAEDLDLSDPFFDSSDLRRSTAHKKDAK